MPSQTPRPERPREGTRRSGSPWSRPAWRSWPLRGGRAQWPGGQVAGLHDGGQVLAALGAGGNLLPEKVAGGEVGEAILGNDLVALGSLATARSSEHPDNGQAGGGQSRAVDGHLDS